MKSIGFCGRYEMTIRKAADNKIVAHRSFPNVITNIGMLAMRNAAVSGSSLDLRHCYVGTGTNTPSVSDGVMGQQQKSFTGISSVLTAPVAPDYVSKKHMTYRLEAGNPGNYSEVGVGWNQSSQGNLYSRALILDEYGNPSTITLLADEYLDVVYTIEGHPSLQDMTGYFELNGVSYSVLSRLAKATVSCFGTGLGAYYISAPFANGVLYVYESQQLGTVEAYPVGTATAGSGTVSNVTALGDENTYGVRSTVSFTLQQGNTPGGVIGALYTDPAGLGYDTNIFTQMSFNPPIPKTNNNTLSLTFEQWFGRYTP